VERNNSFTHTSAIKFVYSSVVLIVGSKGIADKAPKKKDTINQAHHTIIPHINMYLRKENLVLIMSHNDLKKP
jgi:hypothetical protein